MYCKKCGGKLSEKDKFCPYCGEKTDSVSDNDKAYSVYNEAFKGESVPPETVSNGYNNPSYHGGNSYNNNCNNLGNQSYPSACQKSPNGFGIAGFVASVLSLWLGFLFVIPCFVALGLSITGMAKMKNSSSCNGLAIAGLVISIITTVIWGFYFILIVLVLGTARPF